MFETAGVVSANMKLENAAQLMADLIAQQSNETNGMTSNFCTGAQYAMAPLSGTPLKAAVVSVTHQSGGDTVNWQGHHLRQRQHNLQRFLSGLVGYSQ